MNKNEYFRKLPKVDILLKDETVQKLCQEYGRDFIVDCIREELDAVRSVIANGSEDDIEKAIKD